jgi:hypothetical protein
MRETVGIIACFALPVGAGLWGWVLQIRYWRRRRRAGWSWSDILRRPSEAVYQPEPYPLILNADVRGGVFHVPEADAICNEDSDLALVCRFCAVWLLMGVIIAIGLIGLAVLLHL